MKTPIPVTEEGARGLTLVKRRLPCPTGESLPCQLRESISLLFLCPDETRTRLVVSRELTRIDWLLPRVAETLT